MNKQYWLGIQQEILGRKGIYKLWVFLFLFFGTVIFSRKFRFWRIPHSFFWV